MEVLRKCRECGLEAHTHKELSKFTNNPNAKFNKANICKRCASERAKASSTYKENNKKSQVKKMYDITIEEYEEAMSTSDVCEHCGKSTYLCYDHDHTTGKFRGVLCRGCNSALGKLGDDLASIIKMLKYLTKDNR